MTLESQSRRRFFRATAGLAAASFLPVPLARVVQDALAAPAARRTGTLADVEHIVVFTQENRSFDHYFGTLRGVRGFDDRNAITLPNGAPVWRQPCDEHPDGCILPFHIDTRRTSGVCASAPAMSYPVNVAMWNEGRYDAWNTARDPSLGMGHLKRADLGFYYALADAFTICDHYFCSTLTQTNPNRLHIFSGSNGLSVGRAPALDNEVPAAGFDWVTVAELLEQAGVSWRVYQEKNNFDDNAFAWFASFRNAAPEDALHRKGLAPVPDLVEAFARDLRERKLPQVSWIVAPDYLSEHAQFTPADGEALCARLIAALVAEPEVWAKTIFLLNYDEQGGWFDHMPPPMPPASASEGASTVEVAGEIHDGKPIGLGFRVPLIAVSPFSRGGFVCSEVFDHTSVVQLIERRFGIECPNISPWRRAVCGDLTSAFDFSNCEVATPALPFAPRFEDAAETFCAALPAPSVPSAQRMPRQEPGTRRSRALPYALAATLVGATLTLTNSGTRGAVFQLHDARAPGNAPRRYTVGAGATLEVVLEPPGRWIVLGPNGFRRELHGTHALEVELEGTLLRLANRASGALRLRLEAPVYGELETNAMELDSGEEHRVALDLARSGHWYDLRVAIEGTAYERRLAGRVETGAESITDPSGPG